MQEHLHTGPVNILVYGLSAWVVFNLIRFTAAAMVTSDNPMLDKVGRILGASISFNAGGIN